MKKITLPILLLLLIGNVQGQTNKSIKKQIAVDSFVRAAASKPQLSNYQLAKGYLPRIKAFDIKDTAQLAKKIMAEDSLSAAIAKLENFAEENYLLWSLTNPYYNDHSTLSRTLDRICLFYKRANFKYGEFWVRKEMADLHLREGKMKQAEKEMIQLIKEYEKTNFPDLPKYYDLLSGIYLNDSDYKNSLSAAFETLKHVKFASDSLYLPSFYIRVASVYNILGNPKTIDWLYKIFDYYKATNQPYSFYPRLQDYASVASKWNNGKQGLHFITDFYNKYPPKTDADKNRFYLAAATLNTAIGQSKQANLFYQKHNKIAAPTGNGLDIGMYLYHRREYAAARKYFIDFLQHPPPGYPFIKTSGVYLTLYYIDSLTGNYLSAMQNMRYYDAIKDSMFNIAKNKQIEELQITYETAQKQKDIKLLQSKAKIQQIKLKQDENTRNWMLGGAVMLLTLLGLSYNGYRLKQRSNQLFLQKNKMLQHLISEKEWLLKEVHHRVKNNLHTVICLLESQATYLEDDALKAIESSQHRIYAMSLIHQKLYQSDDIKTIDMSLYLPEFIQYLNESFGTQRQILIQLDVEPLQLGISQAIPLALIVNEAVTNSIKYAFTPSPIGQIAISMNQQGQEITLVIADNGIGIDPAIANMPLKSLGLKLMTGLSEDINALITFENNKGTRITIKFQVDPLNSEHNNLVNLDHEKVL